MQRVNKLKKLYLIFAIVSLSLVPVSVLCMVLFGLKLLYAPLIISIVVAAYAFYSAPIFFYLYAKIKLCALIISKTGGTASFDVAELAESLKIKKSAANKLLVYCYKKQFIKDI